MKPKAFTIILLSVFLFMLALACSVKGEVITLKVTDETGDAITHFYRKAVEDCWPLESPWKEEINIRDSDDSYIGSAECVKVGEGETTYYYRTYTPLNPGIRVTTYYYGLYGKDDPTEVFNQHYESDEELEELKYGIEIPVTQVGLYRTFCRTFIQVDEYEERNTNFMIGGTVPPCVFPQNDWGGKDDKGKYEFVKAEFVHGSDGKYWAWNYLKRYTYESSAVTSSYVSENEQEQAYIVLPVNPENLAEMSKEFSEDNPRTTIISEGVSNEEFGRSILNSVMVDIIDAGLRQFVQKPTGLYTKLAIHATANLLYTGLTSPEKLFKESILTDLLIDTCITSFAYAGVQMGMSASSVFLIGISLNVFFEILEQIDNYNYIKEGICQASSDDLFYSRQDYEGDPFNPFDDKYDIIITNRGDTISDVILQAPLSNRTKKEIPTMSAARFPDWTWVDEEESMILEYSTHLGGSVVCSKDLKEIPKIPDCPGDTDVDRKVNYDDLLILAVSYGTDSDDPKYDQRADLNGDGQVDYDDLLILAVNYGTNCAPPLVVNSSSKVWLSIQNKDGYLNIDVKAHLTDTELYLYQFDLNFDQNSLEFISAQEGELLRLDGNDSYWNPPQVKGGSIERILATRLGVKEGMRGEGSLAKFRFRLKDEPPASGFLSIENLKLFNPQGRLIKVDASENRLSLEGYVIPEKSALLQNYPNPFNPETWIPFELAQDADVTINIYDTKGRLVRVLSLGRKPAGYYLSKDKAAYWNGRNSSGERVSSAVYFYTLAAGKFTATKKFILLK